MHEFLTEHTNRFHHDNQSWQGIWITVWINQFVRRKIKISCWYVSPRCCEIQQTQPSKNIYSVALEIRHVWTKSITDWCSEKIILRLKILWKTWFNILLADFVVNNWFHSLKPCGNLLLIITKLLMPMTHFLLLFLWSAPNWNHISSYM